MRLPWPFGRSQRSAEAPPPADVFTARPRGPQAWRDLPVLATSMGKPPLIAPTPPFRDDLAGAAAAPIALAPLTHGHGLDAPSGLAHNLVTAVASVSPADALDREARSALMPTRKRPRPEIAAADAGALDDSPPPAPTPTPVAVTAAVAASPTARPRGSGTSDSSPTSLVRADRQATLPPRPMGSIGPARVAGAMQRAPKGADVADPSPVVATPATRAVAAPAAAAPSQGDRLTLGQSRRRGLGAPLDPAVLQLARTQPVLASSAPPITAPLVLDARPPETPSPIETKSETPANAAPAASAEAMPAVRPAPLDSAPSGKSAAVLKQFSAPPTMAAPIRQRAPRSPAVAPASRPLVSARSPMPNHVQRAPLASAPGSTPASGAPSRPATGSEPVRIHRGSEASSLSGSLDARAFTHAGEIYLPESHGPLTGPKAQSLLAHEMTHVVQQRTLGSSLPHEDSAEGRHLEAQAAAAESTLQMPLAAPAERAATRSGSSAVAPAPPSAAPAELPAQFAGATVPQSMQRARSANDAVWKDPDDAFRASLDSNTDYLFDIFERRLRHALLHERERGGTLIDAL